VITRDNPLIALITLEKINRLIMFKITAKDKNSKARCGVLKTAHGEVKTPIFMPVGTLAAVKSLTPKEIRDCGAQMILANTYHLYLRPRVEIIRKTGGLHEFMSWDGSILTDSGGFQVFSLARLRKVEDSGVEFRSHIDGSKHFLTPEKVMEIQFALGSDVVVPLDECLPYPVEKNIVEKSVKRTTNWALRSKEHLEVMRQKSMGAKQQLLFGIIQGSTYPQLRKEAALRLLEIGFDGYCLGGLSVGEPLELAYGIIEETVGCMDENKPRYLMGVGMPVDLLECVERGIDLFDCVLPTRLGRNGAAFTGYGRINLKNSKFSSDYKPIEEGCECYACKNFTRAYIRHLLYVREMLASRLVSLHNIHFYVNLMGNIREAISDNKFKEFKKSFLGKYHRLPEKITRSLRRMKND
jgi:queuine tRNA-ribosyltransferase